MTPFDADGMRKLATIITPFAGEAILQCMDEIDRLRAAQPAQAPTCTCPSGDGSLRWPCPVHPPEAVPAPVQAGSATDKDSLTVGATVQAQPEQGSGDDDLLTIAYMSGLFDGRRTKPSEQELLALLPGPYYMDPPDGGSPTLLEQLRRMAQDARRYRWLRSNVSDQVPFQGWWRIAGPERPERLDEAIDAELAAPSEFKQEQP
jgi:hypothetical protein